MIANFGVAWLLTYLLHSTLFLGLAWLASRRLARWSAHAEEAVWRFALVGALVTASLQLAAGWEPLAGSWGLPSASAAPAAETSAPAPLAPRSPKATVFAAAPAWTPEPLVARTTEAPTVPVSLPGVVLGVWALGALLLIARYAHSFARLGRRLKDRPRVVGGTLYTQLDRLSGEVGLDGPIRLTSSSRLPVPIALGLSTREICVPPRALVGLTAEQQEGMLAHELAHLARRDPFWLLFSHILSSVFFFQPLNWVARRRLREISELLSDEWAVRRTGRPVSLARCLAEVAGWSVRSLEALPTPGMADRPSHLAHRIRRLLDEARSPERPARRLWLGAAMLALLIAVAAAAPVVSAAAKQHEETPSVEAVVAEAVEPQEPREPEEAIEAEEPEEAEEAEEAEHEHHHDYDHDDSDYDVDMDFELDSAFDFEHEADFDFDFDFELHEEQLEAITEAATQIADATLESLSMELGGLDGLDELGELNEAELHHLEQEIDRATDEIEKSLQPELDRLERVIEQRTEAISKRMTSPELDRLRGEMERMGERMRPSDEEMDRIRAEVEKLRADGGLSADERAKLHSQARRLSEQSRPSAEERKAMQELAKKYREETRRVMGEHRGEIEAMRRDIDQESRALRDQMRQRMKDNPRLREIERKDRERVREEVRREHDKHRSEADRHREHIRKESRERIRERPEPKPRPEPRPRVKVEVDPKVEVEVEVEAGSGSF